MMVYPDLKRQRAQVILQIKAHWDAVVAALPAADIAKTSPIKPVDGAAELQKMESKINLRK